MNNNFVESRHRYVGHFQDDPMIWQKSSDDIDHITAETESMVKNRNIANGSGEGVVVDTITNRIISCFGMPLPSDEIEEARVVDIVMRFHNG